MLKIERETNEESVASERVSDDVISLLSERLRSRQAGVAVLGLGYAGLPMAVELSRAGFPVTGLDIDDERVRLVSAGRSPVSDVTDRDVSALISESRLSASNRFDLLAEADCALICVPTPLTPAHEPDLQAVVVAAQSIGSYLHPGMLVVLQSTCTPGTTRDVLLPILEQCSGLRVGEDFFLAFAPERIDPGNRHFTIANTPKLVGGVTPECARLAKMLFEPFVDEVVTVSSAEVAEMSKLVENTFRFINISFVNELAVLCDRMGISVWDVVDAAASKPFAFMPHYPGPGVGGHCIPVVPFYLEAVARQYGVAGELIAASGRINRGMPVFIADKLERLLGERGRPLPGARILLLGMAYKANVADARESPAPRVLELLLERGAGAEYYDPHVAGVPCNGDLARSISAEELARRDFDCAVLLTAHQGVDYQAIGRRVGFILDTRNHLSGLDGVSVIPL